MIEDRNKTELTKRVTSAAIAYLDERGCKPLETEVPVHDGWIADIAGVLSPTRTELQELKLIRRKPKWNPRNQSNRDQWEREVQSVLRLMTVIVEVKTSVSDFRGDKKWTAKVPANLAYVAIPHDLAIRGEELPAGWGVLEFYESGLRCSRPPEIWNMTTEQQLSLILQVAIRRDHNTRYARLRELQREIRTNRNEHKSLTRVLDAMHAVRAIVCGQFGSAQACLERYGIRCVPKHFMPELEKLWAITPEQQPAKALTDGQGPGTN